MINSRCIVSAVSLTVNNINWYVLCHKISNYINCDNPGLVFTEVCRGSVIYHNILHSKLCNNSSVLSTFCCSNWIFVLSSGHCCGYWILFWIFELNWYFFFFFNFLKEKHIERKILQVFSYEISHLFTLGEIRFKSGSHRWMLLLSVRKFWYSANFCVVSATLSV